MARNMRIGLILVTFLDPTAQAQTPLDAAFTYQGQLKQAGQPANGDFDLEFQLFDAPTVGNQIGDPVVLTDVPVSDGLFTVLLNAGGEFGVNPFNGEARWLDIAVNGTPLLPRQELTGAPYAVFAMKPWESSNGNVFYTAGSVGIGTTSPATVLDVTGTVTADAFVGNGAGLTGLPSNPWQTSGNDIFYTAGSVGIGTTDPGSPSGDTLVIKSASLPSERYGAACTMDPSTGKIYCFGGFNGTDYSDKILEYDPAADRVVVANAKLPTARAALASAASPATGKIYCFGGYDVATGILAQILVYDPTYPYDPGEPLSIVNARLPWGLVELACGADPMTGKIYCFGGGDGSTYRDDILEYDPAYPYEPGQPLPVMDAKLPLGRGGLACTASPTTGSIYCFGGWDGTPFNQILKYDPSYPYEPGQPLPIMTATLPSGRHGLACAADPVTGRIYCFGGRQLEYSNTLDDILEYDPAHPYEPDEIVPIMNARLPSASSDLACAADPVSGRIYCFGGWTGATALAEILEYTPPAQTLLQVGEPGDGTGAIANTWSVFSSRAFKRDIAPLGPPDYQDILAKLKVTDAVRFSYAHDARRTLHLGVIAEDAPAEILSPAGQAVSLADYTTFLMAAIKAQQAMIEEKERLLLDLQAQLAETQARLGRLEVLFDELVEVRGGDAQ